MEEFRIKRNTRSPKIFLGIINFGVFIASIIFLFLSPIVGILFLIGAILMFIFVFRNALGKVEMSLDENGLKYFFKGKLERQIAWDEVTKVEVFDQAHNDFVFKLYVKEGLHFMPDPYDFYAKDMRKAFSRMKELVKEMDIEFVVYDDHKFA